MQHSSGQIWDDLVKFIAGFTMLRLKNDKPWSWQSHRVIIPPNAQNKSKIRPIRLRVKSLVPQKKTKRAGIYGCSFPKEALWMDKPSPVGETHFSTLVLYKSWDSHGILMGFSWDSQIPSGKRLHNYGKSPFFMGKSTISMVIFNSKLLVYQRVKHPTGSGERSSPAWRITALGLRGSLMREATRARLAGWRLFWRLGDMVRSLDIQKSWVWCDFSEHWMIMDIK